MSSDEAYNEFIEYDSADSETSDPDPTTSEGKRKKRQRTTTFQFEKLSNFMNCKKKQFY